MLDPTQLNQADLNTLLRGLAAIGKQGVQLQAELQVRVHVGRKQSEQYGHGMSNSCVCSHV